MKSNRLLVVFQKISVALWCFTLGFCGVVLVLWALEQNGILSDPNDGQAAGRILVGLGLALLKFGLCVVGGFVAAIFSFFFRPAIFLRSFWIACGLPVLVLGGVILFVGPNSLQKFVAGCLAILVGSYMTWTGLFGSRGDVEDPPPL